MGKGSMVAIGKREREACLVAWHLYSGRFLRQINGTAQFSYEWGIL